MHDRSNDGSFGCDAFRRNDLKQPFVTTGVGCGFKAKRQIASGKGGRQVHLLSVRSQLGLRNRGYSAYCSTRGGMVMLVEQHAMELAPHNVTVNGVAPTFVYTEMIRHVMENPEFRKQLESRIPLGRIADPKDVVGPALFFAAPASGFVTGQALYVDGGITSSQ